MSTGSPPPNMIGERPIDQPRPLRTEPLDVIKSVLEREAPTQQDVIDETLAEIRDLANAGMGFSNERAIEQQFTKIAAIASTAIRFNRMVASMRITNAPVVTHP